MALCVSINADGTLSTTGQAVADCTGYVMVSGSEYGVYQVVQTAFATPTPAQATDWFLGAWGTVIFMYMAARLVSSVVGMFSSK